MTLLELLQLLRRHLALVIGLPVACAIVAAVVCWGFMQNEYTAEVSIYALTKGESSNGNQDIVTYSDLNASQMLANDFAELAKNDQVQKSTAESLGMEDLKSFKINIKSSTTTRVIKVEVTSTDPRAAALVANKLAEQIGETAVRVMNVEAVNVISDAKAPSDPSGPRRALYTLVAFLAGLFAAVAIVVLMDMMNTAIRNDDEAVELLGVPVIGRFPMEKGGR